MLALVALAILVGALAQRSTGMGFALVCSPFVVLLLGSTDGVFVVLTCGALASLLIIPRVWRFIEWRSLAWLTIPAVIAIVPGSILVASLPESVMQLIIGAIVVIALTGTLVVTRAQHTVTGRTAAVITGAASGIMNTAAGVGGPPLSIYAVLTRWPQVPFAATIQPYFVVIDVIALGGKFVATGGAFPGLDAWSWLIIVGSMLIGLACGEVVHKHISHRAARVAVIVIAYFGGAAAMANGLFAMLG